MCNDDDETCIDVSKLQQRTAGETPIHQGATDNRHSPSITTTTTATTSTTTSSYTFSSLQARNQKGLPNWHYQVRNERCKRTKDSVRTHTLYFTHFLLSHISLSLQHPSNITFLHRRINNRPLLPQL
jgi:hypothetical protein